MTPSNIKSFIREVPDFPKPGIIFRDITPLIGNPQAFNAVVDWLVLQTKAHRAQAVVGIESRGFIFAAPVAHNLGLPFIPIRKSGKLPAATMSVEYALEYGSSKVEIHQDAFAPDTRVVVIDDLLATGGTAKASAQLVEIIGGQVAAMLFVIELKGLNGRAALEGYGLEALVSY